MRTFIILNSTFTLKKCVAKCYLTYFCADPGIVVAPPSQYGIIGTSSTLNCTTTSSETSSVSITWFYDQENGVRATNQFDRVEISHEGIYVCSVFLGTFNLRAVRMINFSVIGTLISDISSLFAFSLKLLCCNSFTINNYKQYTPFHT